MSSAQEEAKIAFGNLLCSTVASKSGTFAVGGRANEVIPNFPAIPGLLVDKVARIDPTKPIVLPLSEATGAKFSKKKRSPLSEPSFSASGNGNLSPQPAFWAIVFT